MHRRGVLGKEITSVVLARNKIPTFSSTGDLKSKGYATLQNAECKKGPCIRQMKKKEIFRLTFAEGTWCSKRKKAGP